MRTVDRSGRGHPTTLPATGRPGFPWLVAATGDAIFERERIAAHLPEHAGPGRCRSTPAPA